MPLKPVPNGYRETTCLSHRRKEPASASRAGGTWDFRNRPAWNEVDKLPRTLTARQRVLGKQCLYAAVVVVDNDSKTTVSLAELPFALEERGRGRRADHANKRPAYASRPVQTPQPAGPFSSRMVWNAAVGIP